ncbi:MAG: ABC transporter substrate-binding protein [Leptolyngbyaceae cyanobacterium CSU_1_3]|nr:ABC transporter substrate-binding protein [Leptolyngbyaceae cyanobacterium CSU_1_3]
MSQQNETPVLILSLLITAGLLGSGLWWFSQRFSSSSPDGGDTYVQEPPSSGPMGAEPESIAERMSQGEKNLVTTEGRSNDSAFTQSKEAGIGAMKSRQYSQAVTLFESALQKSRNAPETLIYLNNARIADQKAYTIAVAAPIGTDPNGALEILRGVAQAQNEIKQAGGIQGVPLKVTIANDDNHQGVARQIATALAQDSKILGVVGHYASDVTLAAASVYNAEGLVSISPISSTVKLSGFGKYVFRTVPSDYVAARALADYTLKTLQQKNVAVFFSSQSDYSLSLKSELVTAISLAGGKVLDEYDLPDPGFNDEKAVERSLKQGAKVLMLAANSGTLDRALQVVVANRQRLSLLAGDDVYAPKTLEVGREQALGMVVAVPWHIDSSSGTAFPSQSRQLWGGDVNWRSAIAYDAVQALAAALQKSQTRSGIQNALLSPDFSAAGASEGVRFLPSAIAMGGQLVKVSPGSRSGLGFDFVPIAR